MLELNFTNKKWNNYSYNVQGHYVAILNRNRLYLVWIIMFKVKNIFSVEFRIIMDLKEDQNILQGCYEHGNYNYVTYCYDLAQFSFDWIALVLND